MGSKTILLVIMGIRRNYQEKSCTDHGTSLVACYARKKLLLQSIRDFSWLLWQSYTFTQRNFFLLLSQAKIKNNLFLWTGNIFSAGEQKEYQRRLTVLLTGIQQTDGHSHMTA